MIGTLILLALCLITTFANGYFFGKNVGADEMLNTIKKGIPQKEEEKCIHCGGTGIFYTENGPDDFDEEPCVCQMNEERDETYHEV